MFANTEEFFILLVFSLAVGGALGALYDVIMLSVDTVFPYKEQKRGAVILPHNAQQADAALFPIDKRIRARDIALFFSDILFFTVSALSVIILLYHLNYGEVRAFSLISAVAGFTVYRKTVGKPLLFLMKRVIMLLKRIVKKAISVTFVLLRPIRALVKKTVAPFLKRAKQSRTRKKARRYLLLMEEKEERRTAKRKQNNEKYKGTGAER